MILKSAFEESPARVEFEGQLFKDLGHCLLSIKYDSDLFSSCALSRDSARQLAEALLEFANTESD